MLKFGPWVLLRFAGLCLSLPRLGLSKGLKTKVMRAGAQVWALGDLKFARGALKFAGAGINSEPVNLSSAGPCLTLGPGWLWIWPVCA